MQLSREGLCQSALVAEAGARYRDMASAMMEIAEMNIGLREGERHTLAIAYAKVLGESIARLKGLDVLLARDLGDEVRASLLSVRDIATTELWNDCCKITDMIVNHLLPSATSSSGEVFYKKWHADTLRCAAAHTEGNKARTLTHAATECYETAVQAAMLELPPTSSTRLSLILNFSTFLAGVLDNTERAYMLSSTAVEDAASEWPAHRRTGGDSAAKASLLLRLLHINSTAWKAQSPLDAAGDTDTNDDNSSLGSTHDDSTITWH